MTKERIQEWIAGVDKSRPGLRQSNPGLWTNTLALCCWNEDKSVGQKKTKTGPISIDTIGIASNPVFGNLGSEKEITFTGIDLMEAAQPGGTNKLHWDDLGPISNQIFVIPNSCDISGITPISGSNPNPQPNTVPYHGYAGDPSFHEVGRVLAHDYFHRLHHRPPNTEELADIIHATVLDGESVIWTARTIHDNYMEKNPATGKLYTLQESTDKHRAEWCAALGVPVVPIP